MIGLAAALALIAFGVWRDSPLAEWFNSAERIRRAHRKRR